MSKRDKPLDLEALLGAWPAVAAVPSAGFADRVLAAATVPAVPIKLVTAPPPSTRRAFFAGAALAAAFVLVPLFVYRTARPSQQPSITAAASPDLGFERD
jgi:hypothetical protein